MIPDPFALHSEVFRGAGVAVLAVLWLLFWVLLPVPIGGPRYRLALWRATPAEPIDETVSP